MPQTRSLEDNQPEPAAAEAGEQPVPDWQLRLVVLRHHRIVYRVAHALLRDAHEAEDVAQEAFMRYWRHGRGVRRPREWLLAVARNACLDRLRRRRPLVDAGPETLERSDECGPAWHCRQGELAAQLHERIAALPEPHRSLVVLFDNARGRGGGQRIRRLDSRELESQGWQRMVFVQEDGEKVRIHTSADGDRIDGMTIMVIDGSEAVFINIAGAIDPAQLGHIAGAMGMGGMLEQFAGMPGAQSRPESAEDRSAEERSAEGQSAEDRAE